jgi:hypothetical protein
MPFNVYRNGALINSNAASPFIDTGLTNGQQYSYQVSETNAVGEGPKAGPVYATPIATGSRPFNPPTTTNTYNIPNTIDPTGNNEVSSQMNSFISGVPNGSIINFPSTATYKLTNGIYLRDRQHLIFQGNNCTLRMIGTSGSTDHSGFKLDNLIRDIAIHNFKIRGVNPNTTTLYNDGIEGSHGVKINDGVRIEVNNVDVRNVWGDGVFVEGWNTSPFRPSDQVWIHDSNFDYIGRMGIVFNATKNTIAERNTISHVGLFVFDIESDNDWDIVDNVYFRNNTVGSYGLSPDFTNWFFACSGGSSVSQADNIYVQNNIVTIGAPILSPHNTSAKGGLATVVNRGQRIANVVFTGNSTTKSGVGPVLIFEGIDGLTVTGNTQPLNSGSLVAVSNSTNVVTSPNP